MRSSTSSSERVPGGPWLRTWLAALGLALAALAAWDGFWRLQGHAPGVTEDPLLWTLERKRLGSGPLAVAVLGDSRALTGIDLEVLQRELGSERPAQLAIEGSSPVPILVELAGDETFRGLVLLAVNPVRLFEASAAGGRLPREYLERLRDSGAPFAALETRLSVLVQRASALRRSELSPLTLLRLRRWPEPRQVRQDRALPIHYVRDARLRAMERATAAQTRSLPQLEGEPRTAHLARIARAVERIRSRGGEVVLVRMPSSGLPRQAERERAPRERAWDALVRASGAPAIHFEDHPDLAFESPDGSHLDAADSAAFTRALATHVRRLTRFQGTGRRSPE